MGLLWLHHDRQLIELHRDRAVLKSRTGALQTFYRRPVEVGRVALAWELRPRPEARRDWHAEPRRIVFGMSTSPALAQSQPPQLAPRSTRRQGPEGAQQPRRIATR